MTRNSRGKQAGELLLDAERIRNQAAAERQSLLVPIDLRRADELEARVREGVPDAYKEPTVGGELVPVDDGRGAKNLHLRNTVDDPDYIAADASRDRLELLNDAGALGLGLDLADTIEASNSLEKMLAHQMAATHASAMKMTEQMNRQIETMASIYPRGQQSETNNVQCARLAGAIARMMGAFNQGALTLDRLRTGGGQTVVVKHVHQQVQVNDGGQAVIAGEVNPKGGRGGKRGGIAGR
jgi:hypothetical protein